MKAYMEGIKQLFPQYQLRANHHMALHLYEYLRRFGPVHGWWALPLKDTYELQNWYVDDLYFSLTFLLNEVDSRWIPDAWYGAG
jgi:hypothetical protein